MKIACTICILMVILYSIELDASGNQKESSSRAPRKRVHEPINDPSTAGPAHKTVRYDNHLIGLWLDSNGTRVVKADFKGNYVPPGPYFKHHNFFIRLLNEEGLSFVGYIQEDNSLLGVRAPNPNARPINLEPNASTWFIVYCGKSFRVTVNPALGNVEGISLMPKNLHLNPENRKDIKTEEVTKGGVKFLVFRGPTTRIFGAALDAQFD